MSAHGWYRLAAGVVVALVLAAVVVRQDAPEDSTDGRTRVVVDTDMAADDVLALLFLLQRDDVSVEAITVAGTGEVHCGPGVRHARSLLALTQHEGVPVACGASTPLSGDLAFPDTWRAAADGFYGLEDEPGVSSNGDGTATDLLARTLVRRDGKGVTLLTLGPLTNVAGALRAGAGLADALDAVVVMGGAVDVPGNLADRQIAMPVNRAEWNLAVDPAATNAVLALGERVRLVALDATNRVPLGPAFLDRLGRAAHTPAATTALQLLERNAYLVSTGGSFWDPFAAAVLVDPSLTRFVPERLRALESGDAPGALVEDPAAPAVQVAVDARAGRFENLLLATLDNRPAPPARWRPDLALTYRDGAGCRATSAPPRVASQVSITVDSDSADGVAVVLGRVEPGHTFAEVEAIAASGTVTPPPWFTLVRGMAAPPVGAPTWVVDVEPGTYAVVCASWDASQLWAVTSFVAG